MITVVKWSVCKHEVAVTGDGGRWSADSGSGAGQQTSMLRVMDLKYTYWI